MDTAERCFAQQGIAAASIRTIIKEAGVNLGAVTYHFGTKDNLVMEIFKRRMVPLTQERLARLEAAQEEAGDKPVSLRQVLEAIVIPQRRLTKQFPRFAEFLVRMKNYPNPKFYKLINAEFSVVFQKFDRALRATLPPMSDVEFILKIHFLVHLMDTIPENDFHFRQLMPDGLESDSITDIFISFVEGGLMSPQTSALLELSKGK
jgi:AcrR family transcriptional regulator